MSLKIQKWEPSNKAKRTSEAQTQQSLIAWDELIAAQKTSKLVVAAIQQLLNEKQDQESN